MSAYPVVRACPGDYSNLHVMFRALGSILSDNFFQDNLEKTNIEICFARCLTSHCHNKITCIFPIHVCISVECVYTHSWQWFACYNYCQHAVMDITLCCCFFSRPIVNASPGISSSSTLSVDNRPPAPLPCECTIICCLLST